MQIDAISPVINSFRMKPLSTPIFMLPNGVNEFDLINVEGIYYFAYDDHETTQLASSTTLAGLENAPRTTPRPAGHYPSILFDGTSWHLWVWEETCSNHYVADSFNGIYVFHDALPAGYTDLHVRRLSNGIYYAAYKDNTTLPSRVGVMTARDPGGPWLNLGLCFSELGQSAVHSAEEADPAIFDADGQFFLVFSGFDGINQRVLISQIDGDTGKAITPPMTVANPPAGQTKVFNGVYLREDGQPDRIYVAENTTLPNIPGGWEYVEAGTAPEDAYRPEDVARVTFDTVTPVDISNGVPVSLSGNATPTANGLVFSASNEGAFGIASSSNLNDFGVVVEFTIGDLPANGNFALITRISTRNSATQPIIGLWLTATGQLYCEIKKAGNSGPLTGYWNINLQTGQRYGVSLHRIGTAVTGQVNAQTYFTGTFEGPLEGLEEWTLGNQAGRFTNPSQPFTGTIHRFAAVSGPLFASDA